ncbi:hypothetical protein NLU13_3988 [Sarocladium strictum]|uniref:Dipeptidase n=1 Tax=Sarocladium strictum TaxID=5046 RepID=A0AA39GI23_SARSR|nr:hypothetical protein NLU13_3988 [Sarocladium strictum]
MAQLREEAYKLMSQSPLIDGHNDWLHMIRAYYDFQVDDRFEPQKSLAGHVDIKRLREGKAGGVFWSLYIDCPKQENDLSDEVHFEGLRDTLQQVDLAHRVVNLYRDSLEMAYRADDILPIFESGKCVSLLGIEGLHQICNSSSVLRVLYQLGVRYATLAHNQNNLYADSATSKAPLHHGLSPQGRDMIREMNRIGMMIDLSHVSEAVMSDVLELSQAPVVFTHSSCYALVPHPRNVPDHIIAKLGEKRGLLMVSFIPWLTNKNKDEASLNDVVDHIMHVGTMIGYDHVGLGSDFDGMPTQINGLDDVASYVNVVSTMLERGIASDDIKKVMGLNLIRVMKEVELAAGRMAATPALEDKVKQLWSNDIRTFVRKLYSHAEHDKPRDQD